LFFPICHSQTPQTPQRAFISIYNSEARSVI